MRQIRGVCHLSTVLHVYISRSLCFIHCHYIRPVWWNTHRGQHWHIHKNNTLTQNLFLLLSLSPHHNLCGCHCSCLSVCVLYFIYYVTTDAACSNLEISWLDVCHQPAACFLSFFLSFLLLHKHTHTHLRTHNYTPYLGRMKESMGWWGTMCQWSSVVDCVMCQWKCVCGSFSIVEVC